MTVGIKTRIRELHDGETAYYYFSVNTNTTVWQTDRQTDTPPIA